MFGSSYVSNIQRLFYQRIFQRSLFLDLNETMAGFSVSEKRALSWAIDQQLFQSDKPIDFNKSFSERGSLSISEDLLTRVPKSYRQEKKNEKIAEYFAECFNKSLLFSRLEKFHQFIFKNSLTDFDEFCLRFMIGQGILIPTESLVWQGGAESNFEHNLDNFLKLTKILCSAVNRPSSVELLWTDKELEDCSDENLRKLLEGLLENQIQIIKAPWLSEDSKNRLKSIIPSKIAVISSDINMSGYTAPKKEILDSNDLVFIDIENNSEHLFDPDKSLSALQKTTPDPRVTAALREHKDILAQSQEKNTQHILANKFLISERYISSTITGCDSGRTTITHWRTYNNIDYLKKEVENGAKYSFLDLSKVDGIDESNPENLELFIQQLALMQIRTIYINQEYSDNFRSILNIIQKNNLPISLKAITLAHDLSTIKRNDLHQLTNLKIDIDRISEEKKAGEEITLDDLNTTGEFIDPDAEISVSYEQEQEQDQDKDQDQNSEEDDFNNDSKHMPVVRRHEIVPIKLFDLAMGKKDPLLYQTNSSYGLDLAEFMFARRKKIHDLLEHGHVVKICGAMESDAKGGVGKPQKYIGLKASPQSFQLSNGTTFYDRLLNLSRISTSEVLIEKNIHIIKAEACCRTMEFNPEIILPEELLQNLNKTMKQINLSFFPEQMRDAISHLLQEEGTDKIIGKWRAIKHEIYADKEQKIHVDIALFYLATLPAAHPLNLANLINDPDINFSSGTPNFLDQLNSFDDAYPFSSDEQIYLSLKIASKKSFFSSNPYWVEKKRKEAPSDPKIVTIKDLVTLVEDHGLKNFINDFELNDEQNADLCKEALAQLRKDPCSKKAFEKGQELLRLTSSDTLIPLKQKLEELQFEKEVGLQTPIRDDLYTPAKNNLKAIFKDEKYNFFHEIIDNVFSKQRISDKRISDATDFPKHFLIKYGQIYLSEKLGLTEEEITTDLPDILKRYEELYQKINKSVQEGKFNYKSLPKLHRYLFQKDDDEPSYMHAHSILKIKIDILNKLFPLIEDVELLDQFHGFNFSFMNLCRLALLVENLDTKEEEAIFLGIIKDFNQQSIDKKLTVEQRLKIYEQLTPLVGIYQTHQQEYGQQSYKRNYISGVNSALINNLFVREKNFEQDLEIYSKCLNKLKEIKNENPKFYVHLCQSIHPSKKYSTDFWSDFLQINHSLFNLSFQNPEIQWKEMIHRESESHAQSAITSIGHKSSKDQEHYARFFKDDHYEFGAIEAGLQGLSELEKQNLLLSLTRYNAILQDDWFKKASIEDLKIRFHRNKEIISKLDPSTSSYQDILLETLAIVSFVVAQTSTFGFAPQATQQISVLLKLMNPRQMQQIATGEGKTLTSAIHSIMEYAKGRSVEYVTSSESLAQQSFEKMGPLFSLLEIPYTRLRSNTDKSLEEGITISDINKRVLTSLEHQENPRALAANSSFIIDEVDYLLNDLTTEFKIPQLIQDFEQVDDLKDFYQKVDLFKVNLSKSENDQANDLRRYLQNEYRSNKSLRGTIRRMPLFILKDLINAKKTAAQMTAVDQAGHLVHDGKIFASVPNLGSPSPEYYARPLIEGEMQLGSNFALHVQQLLHIKLNKMYPDRIYPIQYPSDVYASHRVDTFLKYVLTEGHAVGLTGTVGTIQERDSVEKRYPGMKYYRIPSYLQSKRVDEGKVECTSDQAHLEAVEAKIKQYLAEGRPIYLVTENDTKKTQYWFNVLKKLKQPVQLWDARGRSENGEDFEPSDDTQFSKMRDFAGKPGNISIVTVGMGGRGVDLLAVTEQGEASEKGLGVCVVDDIPARSFYQAIGRTGRQGKEGISCQIINIQKSQKSISGQETSELELNINRKMRDAYDYLVNHPLGIVSNWPEFVKRIKKEQAEAKENPAALEYIENKINTIFEEIFKIKLSPPKPLNLSEPLPEKSLKFINHHHLTSVYSIKENSIEEPLKAVIIMTPLAYAHLSTDRKKAIQLDSTRELVLLDESELKKLSELSKLEDIERFSFKSIKALKNKVNQDTEFHIVMGDTSESLKAKNPFNFLEMIAQTFIQDIQKIMEIQPVNIHTWHNMDQKQLNDSMYALELDSVMFQHRIADSVLQADLAIDYALNENSSHRSGILSVGRHTLMKRDFIDNGNGDLLLGFIEEKREQSADENKEYRELQDLQTYLLERKYDYSGDISLEQVTEFLRIFNINKEMRDKLIFAGPDSTNEKMEYSYQYLIRTLNQSNIPKSLEIDHPCIKKLIELLDSEGKKIPESLIEKMNLNSAFLTSIFIKNKALFPRLLAAGFNPSMTFTDQYSLQVDAIVKTYGLNKSESLKEIDFKEIIKSSKHLKKIIEIVLKNNKSENNKILKFIVESNFILPILLNLLKIYLSIKAFLSLTYQSYLYFKNVNESLKYKKEDVVDISNKEMLTVTKALDTQEVSEDLQLSSKVLDKESKLTFTDAHKSPEGVEADPLTNESTKPKND